MKFQRDSHSQLLSYPKLLDHEVLPPSRRGSCCVTERISYDVYCFGGYGKVLVNDYNSEAAYSPLNDLWVLKKENWIYLQGDYEIPKIINNTIMQSKPEPRAHCACWMGDDRTLYIAGGENNKNEKLQDVWALKLDDQMINKALYVSNLKPVFIERWIRVNDLPLPLSHAASWKTPIERFWLFGGETTGKRLVNDLWRFDKNKGKWHLHDASSCYPYNETRTYPNCKKDPFIWTDEKLNFYLYGGSELTEKHAIFSDTNDFWYWKEGKWIALKNKTLCNVEKWIDIYQPDISHPDCRSAGITWHSSDKSLWLWGGTSNSMIKGDAWSYDIEKNSWKWKGGSPLFNSPSFVHKDKPHLTLPPSLKHSSSWVDRNGLFYIAFGEDSNQNFYSEIWTYRYK